MSAAMLFTMLLCFALSISVAVSIGLSAMVGIQIADANMLISVKEMFNSINKFPLAAIPFFILAGNLMETGGISKRLVEFAKSIVGGVQGGLPMTCVLTCMIFAAVSGSSPATVVAIGSIMLPAMLKQGYPKSFGAGVVTTSGALGILIPPSIVMVMYSVSTNTSVGKLFMAGVIPGLMLAFLLGLTTWVLARKRNYPRMPRASVAERWRAFQRSVWGLLLIVVVIGGIYSGMFTPTEAAAVSAVYAFSIAVFVYKDLTIRQVPKVLLDSASMSAMLLYIITNAVLFSFLMTSEGIPQAMASSIMDMGLGMVGFLLVVNLLLLLAGNVMEPSSIVLIMAPILFPVAIALGVDPVHFGIIMVVNMEIGMCHPPVGLNLYVASGITKMGITELTIAVLPWLMTMIGFLFLVTYVPEISLWLPRLVFGS
jgi:C4-dicarboxylate transporter DctM subunit